MTRKQAELLQLIELCGYMIRSEINKSVYPDSTIDALIAKGWVIEVDGDLFSSTDPAVNLEIQDGQR